MCVCVCVCVCVSVCVCQCKMCDLPLSSESLAAVRPLLLPLPRRPVSLPAEGLVGTVVLGPRPGACPSVRPSRPKLPVEASAFS